MNPAYLHLVLNHIPVMGVLFGLALYLAAHIRKSTEMRRVALWVFLLAALSAVPAFLTGEPAEDLVEKVPGVSKQAVEAHEEFASVALGGIILLGAAALGALVFSGRSARMQKGFAATVVVCSLVASVLMIRTAQLGGQIRHTELRPVASVQGSDLPGSKNSFQDEDDD